MLSPDDMTHALTEIAARSHDPSDRAGRAGAIAGVIRAERGYRWVGVYDVEPDQVCIIGWAGPAPPAYPRFPVDRGLTARAIATGSTVVVNDVALEPAYLEAFGDTRAELIVPIVRDGMVVGTIDVESERVNGFGPLDVVFVEACSTAARGLW